jgi:hypothetical protein
LKAGGLAQKIDDFSQVLLGGLEAGDVVECNIDRAFLLEAMRALLEEPAERSAARQHLLGVARKDEPCADDQEPRQDPEQDPNGGGLFFALDDDLHPLFAQRREQIHLGCRGNHRSEIRHRMTLHRFGDLQPALGVLPTNRERFDLAVGDEGVKGAVADRRMGFAVGRVRLPGVRSGEQDAERDPVLPAEPRRVIFGRGLRGKVVAGHVSFSMARFTISNVSTHQV